MRQLFLKMNCLLCKKKFSKTYQCSVHKKLHAFTCSDCGQKFYSKTDLHQHAVDHVDFTRICKICNEIIIGVESYECHREMHDRKIFDETEKHGCDNCGRYFEYKKAMKSHRSICDNKPFHFQCDFCTARPFTRKFDLEQHVRTHTSEYTFICDICNKGFLRKSQLLAHLRLHSIIVNDYPFECKKCEATFATKYNLKRHASRFHTEEAAVMDVEPVEETTFTVEQGELTVEEVTSEAEQSSLLIGLEIEILE